MTKQSPKLKAEVRVLPGVPIPCGLMVWRRAVNATIAGSSPAEGASHRSSEVERAPEERSVGCSNHPGGTKASWQSGKCDWL